MSEKIKLSDSSHTTFDLVANGIQTKESEKVRLFMFTSSLTYEAILSLFSTESNLSTVTYLLSDGSTGMSYTDCVKLNELSYNTEESFYTAIVSIDSIQRALQALQGQVNTIKSKVDNHDTELNSVIDGMTDLLVNVIPSLIK